MAVDEPSDRPTDTPSRPDPFIPGVARWGKSFIVDDGATDGFIRLAQTGRRSFKLESSIEYVGATGLEHLALDVGTVATLRTLRPEDLPDTELESVPKMMRWWVNTYGVHTPAVLIHDRFIGGLIPDGIDEAGIDRYFRFMLKDSGVRFLKRWMMWTTTALRTRFLSGGLKRARMVLWVALAVAGIFGFLLSALSGRGLVAFGFGLVGPVVFSALWGRQYGAGLIASWFVMPWLVPVRIVTSSFLLLYALSEYAITPFLKPEQVGTEPILWPAQDDHEGERFRAEPTAIAEPYRRTT